MASESAVVVEASGNVWQDWHGLDNWTEISIQIDYIYQPFQLTLKYLTEYGTGLYYLLGSSALRTLPLWIEMVLAIFRQYEGKTPEQRCVENAAQWISNESSTTKFTNPCGILSSLVALFIFPAIIIWSIYQELQSHVIWPCDKSVVYFFGTSIRKQYCLNV